MEKMTVKNEVVRVFFSVLEKYVVTKVFETDLKTEEIAEVKKYALWMIHEFYFALQTLNSFELEFNEKDLVNEWEEFSKVKPKFKSP